MSLYPDIERINPNDFYFVVFNGEPIQPANTDMLMDYWTAETVTEFLQAVNPDKIFTIEKAIFIDNDRPLHAPKLEVLK